MTGIKRYHIDAVANGVIISTPFDDGDWVPADIAQELYDFLLEIKKFGFSNPAHEIYGYDRIDEIITRASGEQEQEDK